MTNPAVTSSNSSIDLQASAARRAAARRLAADQAGLVAAQTDGASEASIDLLFLLQESVLVFDETHAMLTALAAAEQAPDATGELPRARRDEARGPTSRRPLVAAAHVVAFLAVLAAAMVLIEVVDPLPLSVQAVGSAATVPHP